MFCHVIDSIETFPGILTIFPWLTQVTISHPTSSIGDYTTCKLMCVLDRGVGNRWWEAVVFVNRSCIRRKV